MTGVRVAFHSVVFFFFLLWAPPLAGQEDVDIEACRRAGEIAGTTAAPEVCKFLENRCPAPNNMPRNAGSSYPRYLFSEVRKSTCVLLYQNACKQALTDEVIFNSELANCVAILSFGSGVDNKDALDECKNVTEVLKIWDEAVEPICGQTVPPSTVELQPPLGIQYEEEATAANDGDELVSQGRPTYQSTTAYGLESSLAVDGKLNTIATCTHTGYGDGKEDEESRNPWWSIDLGAKREITRILVTNRGDCCGDRINNFEIRVGDSGPLGDGSQDAPTLNEVCGNGLSISTGETKEFSCDLEGRYVTIRIPGDSRILTLCEVQVYAAVDESIVITNDVILSRGKPTFQSSTLWGGSSSRAVDGNKNGVFKRKTCTHTGISPEMQATPNPWWAVDLGVSREISAVRIATRSDCCHDRLYNFEIRIGDAKPMEDGHQNAICQSGLKIPRGETYQYHCPMRGRYVSIRLPGNAKILTLCEVEVIE